MNDIKFRAWNGKMVQLEKIDLKLTHSQGIPMMYTGRKDKNGVEIFEGDIVECGDFKSDVFFFAGCFSLNGVDVATIPLGLLSRRYEVIGNIYENPELLEAT